MKNTKEKYSQNSKYGPRNQTRPDPAWPSNCWNIKAN